MYVILDMISRSADVYSFIEKWDNLQRPRQEIGHRTKSAIRELVFPLPFPLVR
jgi:hypothetical protein